MSSGNLPSANRCRWVSCAWASWSRLPYCERGQRREMTTQRLRPVLINELLDPLFSGAAHELHDCCARWCASSPHFATFLDRYRDKIRKKLRVVTDGEGLRDLPAELRTAPCLLSERAFTLENEKYTANKTRRPDFRLLFKTHIPFNVEVKRIRGQVQP